MAILWNATNKAYFPNTPKSMSIGTGGSGYKVYGLFTRKDNEHISYQVWPPMREVGLDNPALVDVNSTPAYKYINFDFDNTYGPEDFDDADFRLEPSGSTYDVYLNYVNVSFPIKIMWSLETGSTLSISNDIAFAVKMYTSDVEIENSDGVTANIGQPVFCFIIIIPSGRSFTGTLTSDANGSYYKTTIWCPAMNTYSMRGNIYGQRTNGSLMADNVYVYGSVSNTTGFNFSFPDSLSPFFMSSDIYVVDISNLSSIPGYTSNPNYYNTGNCRAVVMSESNFDSWYDYTTEYVNGTTAVRVGPWTAGSSGGNKYLRIPVTCDDENFKFYDDTYHINKKFTTNVSTNLSAFYTYAYTGYNFLTNQPTNYTTRYFPSSSETSYLTYHNTYGNILYDGEIDNTTAKSLKFYEDNLYHLSYTSTISTNDYFNENAGYSKYTPIIKFENISYEYYETNNLLNTDSKNVINYRYKLSSKFSQKIEYAPYDYTLTPDSSATTTKSRFYNQFRLAINTNTQLNILNSRTGEHGSSFTVFVSPYNSITVGFKHKNSTGAWTNTDGLSGGDYNHAGGFTISSTNTTGYHDYDFGNPRWGRNYSFNYGYGNISSLTIYPSRGTASASVNNNSGGTISFTPNNWSNFEYYNAPYLEVRVINNNSSGGDNQNFAWAMANAPDDVSLPQKISVSTSMSNEEQTFYIYAFYNSYPDRVIRFHVVYLGSFKLLPSSVHTWKYRFAPGPPIGGGVGADDIYEIMSPETVRAASFSVGLRKNNALVNSGVTWAISSGSTYASINSSGLVTIKSGANNSNITISATYNGNTYTKVVKVTYLAGATGTTVVTYGENGESTVTTTITNGDGSSSSSSTTYDENGNPVSGQNQNTDANGNVNTQEIEYDENGEPYNVGYTIDTSGGSGSSSSGSSGIDSGVLAFDGRDFVATLDATITYANITTGVTPIINLSDNSTGKVNGACLMIMKLTTGYCIDRNGTKYPNSGQGGNSGKDYGVFRLNEYIDSTIGTGNVFVHASKAGSAASGGSYNSATRFGMKNTETTARFIFILRYTNNILSAEVQYPMGTKIAVPASNQTWDFTGNELRTVTVEIGKWTNYSGGQYIHNIQVHSFDIHKTS